MKRNHGNQLTAKIVSILLASAFFTSSFSLADAPILPDTKAPGNRQPMVQETANGIPLVNIAAPSAGGVSRNDYERFNVPERGAILNNSYTMTQTELAGYVQGNANMAAQGSAKIIVNQVTSANPTAMNGFLEVAGSRADVIIANPNGITVNGGGFINTSRAILTTGRPEFDDKERLKDLRVESDGTILVTGNGLNADQTDVLELYTRAAEIQAAVYGNTVKLTTGANVIDADTGEATVIEGKGKKPEIAIDVKDLGGMYAGRIFIIGNEKGLPIDIKGAIESQHLVLDNQGNLYHAGKTHTTEEMTVHASDIKNTGVIAASGQLDIHAEGKLTNTNTLGSEENVNITSNQVKNSGTIASEKELSMTASSADEYAMDNETGEILANGNITIKADHSNNTSGKIASGTNLSIQGKTLNNTDGKLTAYGNNTLTVMDKLDSTQGQIAANGEVSISSQVIRNTRGKIAAGQNATILTKDIQSDGEAEAQEDNSLDNESGEILANGNITIKSDDINSTKGNISSGGNLSIQGKVLNSTAGKLIAYGNNTLFVTDKLDSTQGQIAANGDVFVYSTIVRNTRGTITAGQSATILTKDIQVDGETVTQEDNSLDNESGEILVNGDITIKSDQINSTKGNMESGSNLSIQGKTLNNAEGKLTAYGNSILTVTDKLNSTQGQIEANGDISISSQTIQNTRGKIVSGQNVTIFTKDIQSYDKEITLDDNSLDNESGEILANGDITIKSDQINSKNGNIASGSNLQMTGKTFNNTDGKVTAYDSATIAATDKLDNTQGQIAANRDISVSSDVVRNTRGTMTAGQDETITTKDIQLDGKLSAGNNLSITTEKDISNETAEENYGITQADGDLTLTTKGNLSNKKKLEAKGTLTLRAKDISNAENGEINGGNISVTSASLANLGLISADEDNTITTDTLQNTATGRIYGEDITISAKALENRKDKNLEEKLAAAIKDLRQKEKDLDDAYAVDVTAFSSDEEKEAYFETIEEKREAYTKSKEAVDVVLIEMGNVKSATVAARNNLTVTGDTLLNTASSLFYAGGDLSIYESKDITNRGADIKAQGNVSLIAPKITNENEAFSAERVWISQVTNPNRIRIDESGHPERGQAFGEEEFSDLSTAYGVFHINGVNSSEAAKNYHIDDYTIIRTVTHTSEKQVRETKAGTISSGKDMALSRNVTNENSRITAGGTLTATSGTLDNIADKNQVQHITFGTTQASYTEKESWPHKAWRRHYRDKVFMTPQKELENPTSLSIDAYAGNTGKHPSKEDITQTMRDTVQQNLNPFPDVNTINPETQNVNLGSTDVSGTALSFVLDSSLYKINPQEEAKYLIETDPAFTNKKSFLSSDYMYEQMLWDNDKVSKRLGDGFYEQELIRNQITQLTGMRYLNGYTDDEEQYKALMNAGIAYAKEYNLEPGISLSKEQMASLTGDIVWLETTTVTVGGKTYDVLYPHVYLKAGTAKTLTEDGSIISANTLVTDTKETLTNQGTLKGNTIVAKSKNIVNDGKIFARNVSLKATQDITQSGLIEGEDVVSLDAGRNISMKETIQHGKNQDILDTTAGIAIKGTEGVLLMQAGQDISLTGATLSALGENGSVILSAGNNLNMGTDVLTAKKDMTENADNYLRTYRRTETANTITAGKDITLVSGNDIKMRNTIATAENGAVTVQAVNDVTIENGYNEATDDYGLKFEVSGFLSSITTTIKSHDESKTATGSVISGDTVNILSGGNTQVVASNIVGTNDVNMTFGKNVTITSAEEKEKHDYEKHVEKSGIFGGGGLGIFIGSEERSDQYKDADTLQKGSTVGSVEGNVTIVANKDIHVEASDILAGKNISMSGENVEITSKDNTYHSDEKHEYKRSGLSVSAGGGAVSAVESVAAPVKRMTEVSDSRLKALYGYETVEAVKKNEEALKAAANGNFSPTISIGIGSSESKSESHRTITEAQGSTVQAGQDVIINARKDIAVKGSDVSGNNVNLEAGKDIQISAAEENETYNTNQSSQGSSIGVNISAGSIVYVSGNSYSGKGNENGSATGNKGSTVTAIDTMAMKSGEDTNIVGSTVAGNKVKADVGGNLNIESLQMQKDYNEESTYVGGGFSVGAGKTTYAGSASKGNMDSNYESVSDQAGIYAGDKGFDINVKENTNLKAGVIDSSASKDKNTLTTGTLTWEDTENKADYKAGGMGVSYASKDKGSEINQRGLTPNVTPTVKDSADSTTKSAVAEGTINITDKANQKQDISTLNRDMKNSLNQLQEIFDKTKVEEKQELMGMLGKYGNQIIHKYSESKGYEDGSTEKMLLHGAFGALMGDMAGGSAATGSLAGGVNEYVIGYLTKTKGENWVQEHPDTVQWISAGVGAALGNLSDGNGLEAAGIALLGTQWNYLGEGHENIKPQVVGIGVETEGLGHVAIAINFEDGTWAEGNYGRYGGNGTPSSGLSQTPVGTGTYLTDNNFNPLESDRIVYMLDPVIVSASRAMDEYNSQFLNNDYMRLGNETMYTGGRTSLFARYRKGEGSHDYNLLWNNCVTTTMDAINKGQTDWNLRAEFTLMLLRKAKSPAEVGYILNADYEQFGGKGLVVEVKKGDKVKK